MIDINELRRLAQAATPHVGHACKYQDAHWLREGHVDFENADLFIASERPQEDAAFYAAANPATVIELLNRLEAAESDCLEQARLNGIGASREAALMAKLEAGEKERESWKGLAQQFGNELDTVRAKIAEMEKQEPFSYMYEYSNPIDGSPVWRDKPGYWNAQFPKSSKPLYLAPGAQPAPSVPEGWKLVPIEPTPGMIDAAEYVDWGDADVRGSCINAWDRMLAAAPEAKP